MGKTVRIERLNWDQECRIDFLRGKGFEITEPCFKGKDENKEKSMYGTHSPLFATDWEDDNAFNERYSCKCGNLKGRVYEDEICPTCNSKVKFRDVDLDIFGWIKLHNNYIIQPIFYRLIKSLIGDKVFTEILEYDKEITKNGIIINKKSKNPFKGIGMIEFKERFLEIILYYKNKKKNKVELANEILREEKKVFASCLPVYSSVLRPVSFRGETYFYNTIDKKYNSIFSLAQSLNANNSDLLKLTIKKQNKKRKKERMDEATKLQSLQKKVMELWDLVFEQINQKEGHGSYVSLHGNMQSINFFNCGEILIA